MFYEVAFFYLLFKFIDSYGWTIFSNLHRRYWTHRLSKYERASEAEALNVQRPLAVIDHAHPITLPTGFENWKTIDQVMNNLILTLKTRLIVLYAVDTVFSVIKPLLIIMMREDTEIKVSKNTVDQPQNVLKSD
jgi:hypothetical protein